ncbi:MAG: hypothetical protein H0V89_03225 [Deltaproteobacteria bacterium]|nr:hypothetical protein [Deltaproteobacteria bacterium]
MDDDRDRIAAWLAVDVEALLADAPALRRRDIAVLVHTHREGERIQEALRARGIASVRHSQSDVLLSSEAGELARLLAAVLEPQRRARVGTALAGSLLGRVRFSW